MLHKSSTCTKRDEIGDILLCFGKPLTVEEFTSLESQALSNRITRKTPFYLESAWSSGTNNLNFSPVCCRTRLDIMNYAMTWLQVQRSKSNEVTAAIGATTALISFLQKSSVARKMPLSGALISESRVYHVLKESGVSFLRR